MGISLDVRSWDNKCYRLIDIKHDDDLGAMGVFVSYESGEFLYTSLDRYHVYKDQLDKWSKE